MEENMKHLRDPKFWASVSAWMVPVSTVILWPIGIFKNWTISEIGTIIGAIAGPFAGLAGFLFVYVSFLEQQKQFNAHQMQILRQGFEIGLYDLINKLLLVTRDKFPSNPKLGLMPYLKQFENEYRKSSEAFEVVPIEILDDEDYHKINYIPRHYLEAFKSSIRGVKEIIKSFVGILHFIEIGEVDDKGRYHTLLFNQMSQAETRVIFYGYFHHGFKLTDEEKLLIKNFFLKFNGRDLLDPKDIQLM